MSTMAARLVRTDPRPPPWYRVPFVWFVIALFVAMLAAAIHLIIVSVQADDPSVLDPKHEQVFKVPVSTAKPAPDTEQP